METIKLTTDGTRQVVVLPEQFHLSGNEVYIKKMGNAIVSISKEDPWRSLINSLEQFSTRNPAIATGNPAIAPSTVP